MWRNLLIDFSRRKVSLIIFSALVFLLNTSCDNFFESFADKSEDEALLFTAKKAIRDADYDAAVEACTLMSAGYYAKSAAADVCSAAYAGRCGFTLTGMITTLGAYPGLPSSYLGWFITQLDTATNQAAIDKATDCSTAEEIIRSQGDASERTADQNLLMLLLSLQTMAAIADSTADSNFDDVLDPAFDACIAGDVSATEAQNFGSAFWEFDKVLDVLQADPDYTALDTLVDAICAAPEAQGLCAATSPLALAAGPIKGARTILKEGVFGVNQCGGNIPISGLCNCP
jgi:hypothetical protein